MGGNPDGGARNMAANGWHAAVMARVEDKTTEHRRRRMEAFET